MSEQRAVVIHNVCPMRATPQVGSEQVSQAIMGDNLTVLEKQGEYARVRSQDAYEGWMLESQFRRYAQSEWPVTSAGTQRIIRVRTPFADVYQYDSTDSGLLTRLVFDTPLLLPEDTGAAGALCRVVMADASEGYLSSSDIGAPGAEKGERSPPELAKMFVGTPYLWGGTTPFGFDCSGLVQRCYSAVGIVLPRDAYQQVESPLGSRLTPQEPLEAGDLVFFCGKSDPRNRGVTHVGMMLDMARMVHAYGRTGVTIHRMNDIEITQNYAYRGAWRYTPHVS